MEAYQYNPENGEFIAQVDCQIDPVRSQREGREIFLLPGNSTWVAPPEFDSEAKKAIWDGLEWKLEGIKFPEVPDIETDNQVSARVVYTADDLLSALLGGTLANESGGGGNLLETLAALGVERYNALSALFHAFGFCGEVSA